MRIPGVTPAQRRCSQLNGPLIRWNYLCTKKLEKVKASHSWEDHRVNMGTAVPQAGVEVQVVSGALDRVHLCCSHNRCCGSAQLLVEYLQLQQHLLLLGSQCL